MAARTILVEGNIASGKSTLIATLAERRPDVVDGVMEEIGRDFLDAFHTQPAHYGFALQMVQQLRRAHSLSVAPPLSRIRLLDRSVVGDYAFALWNAALGNLNAVEWRLYREQAGQRIVLPPNAAVVWLVDDADSCLARRRRRDKHVPDNALMYMRGLHVAHMLVLATLPASTPVLEWQWRAYTSHSSDASIDRVIDAFRHGISPPVRMGERAMAALDELACSDDVRRFLASWFDDNK